MDYKSLTKGLHLIGVLRCVKREILDDVFFLEKILREGLNRENFKILGSLVHKFEPQGCSIIIALSESHAAIHTYPEYDNLYFDIYSCLGPESGKITYEYIKDSLEYTSEDTLELIIDVGETKISQK